MAEHAERDNRQRKRSVLGESFIGGHCIPRHLTAETKPFLSDRFDVHDYANAVLRGATYDPDAKLATDGHRDSTANDDRREQKGDLSTEVARLNYGIVRGPRLR